MSDKEQILVTNLDQLDDRVTLNIVIDRPGDAELIVPIRELDYQDWLQVEFDHPLPNAPVDGADRHGRKTRNTSDPAYLQSLTEVIEKRDYVRLLMALQIDIPGETEDEQMATLAKLPATVIRTLRGELNALHSISEARVEGHANGFQPGSGAGTTTIGPQGVDADTMEIVD